MQLHEVPMPAAVAARPRDARGYPVPAITPWEDGAPRFAAAGVARTFLCAVERRCSICGTTMAPGPVWRVVGGAEADMMAASVANAEPYRNQAPTAEAPGHRACMLFAAMVCPYLARPNAHRRQPGSAPGLDAARGDRRGRGGGVVGFRTYEFEYAGAVLFRFSGLCEFRRHDLGEEHLPELRSAIAAEPSKLELVPEYLLDDEGATHRAFSAYLHRLLG